jgi:hypothetical protein
MMRFLLSLWGTPCQPTVDAAGLEVARRCRERAESWLEEVRSRADEVAGLAEDLRTIRRENHLYEIVKKMISEREGGHGGNRE